MAFPTADAFVSTVRALKGGAVDFLEKPVEAERLLAALGEGERAVFDEVVAGRLNKQIAGRLGIAEGTVKVHRSRVMTKMTADSLAAVPRVDTWAYHLPL